MRGFPARAAASGKCSKMVMRAADSQFRPIADDEERIPLFALNFAEGDQRKRRLFAGLVPVGKRDAYLGAAAGPPGASGPPTSAKTSRKILLRKEVIEPWKQLIERARKTRVTLIEKVDGNPTPDKANLLKVEREQIQTASWYLLLDLARYLRDYIPNVHQRIVGQAPNPPLNSAQQSLINTLDAIAVGPNLAAELRTGSNITKRRHLALRRAQTHRRSRSETREGRCALSPRWRRE